MFCSSDRDLAAPRLMGAAGTVPFSTLSPAGAVARGVRAPAAIKAGGCRFSRPDLMQSGSPELLLLLPPLRCLLPLTCLPATGTDLLTRAALCAAPTHFAVVFDAAGKNFRHELYR